MKRKRSIIGVLLVVVLLIMAGVTLAEAMDAGPIKLFEEKKIKWTISEKGETVIPIDFGEVLMHHISIKANSEKQLFYYLDYDGLHVIPIAKGKMNITFTNNENKKEKSTIEIAVEENAISDSEELEAYVAFENSYVNKSNDLIVKYFITGGNKPYSCSLSYNDYSNKDFNVFREFTAKKSLGTSKTSFDRKANNVILRVKDADGNVCMAISNPLFILKDYQIKPEFSLLMVKSKKTLDIPFKIIGGSGKNELTSSVRITNGGFTMQDEKSKQNAEEEFVFELSPTSEGDLDLEIQAKDKKGKKIDAVRYSRIPVRTGTIKLYCSESTIHTGEEVKWKIEVSDINLSEIASAEVQTAYASKDKGITVETVKGKMVSLDKNHKEISFTPEQRGIVNLIVYSRSGTGMMGDAVVILP